MAIEELELVGGPADGAMQAVEKGQDRIVLSGLVLGMWNFAYRPNKPADDCWMAHSINFTSKHVYRRNGATFRYVGVV